MDQRRSFDDRQENDARKQKAKWFQKFQINSGPLGYQTLTFSHNCWKASWLSVLPRRNSSDQPWPKASLHQCLASYYFDVVHRYFILVPDPSKLLLMPFSWKRIYLNLSFKPLPLSFRFSPFLSLRFFLSRRRPLRCLRASLLRISALVHMPRNSQRAHADRTFYLFVG